MYSVLVGVVMPLSGVYYVRSNYSRHPFSLPRAAQQNGPYPIDYDTTPTEVPESKRGCVKVRKDP